MSDPENFVARWSRLKREKADDEGEKKAPVEPVRAPAALEKSAQGVPEAEAQPRPRKASDEPFDPASLPPLDSIAAGADIRAFLQSGVPAELTKAALRRAWAADPAIRDFIGLAENQWDFTDPAAIQGFGSLEADQVRRLVAQAMGQVGEAGDDAALASAEDAISPRSEVAVAPDEASQCVRSQSQASGIPDRNANALTQGDSVEEKDETVSVAPQHGEKRAESPTTPNRRGHGRALPR